MGEDGTSPEREPGLEESLYGDGVAYFSNLDLPRRPQGETTSGRDNMDCIEDFQLVAKASPRSSIVAVLNRQSPQAVPWHITRVLRFEESDVEIAYLSS